MLTLLMEYLLWFWSHKELLSASKILHKNVSCICYAQMVWTGWARPGSPGSRLSLSRAGPVSLSALWFPLQQWVWPGLAQAGRAARARTADRLPASEIWRVERKTILRQKVYSPVESYLIKMELEDPGSGGEWMVDSGHQMSSIITILDIMRWCKKCLISNKSFKTSWSWLLVIVNIY